MKLYGFWRSLAAFRVRIALNLKGIAYDEVSINLLTGAQHSDEYKRVNPQGVVPALIDGDAPVLFQSLAILEYLDEKYPQPALLPGSIGDRARVRGLAQIVACDAHPLVVPRIRSYLEKDLALDEPTRNKWIQHWVYEAVKAIEANLAADKRTGTYCHGEQITVADICLATHMIGGKLFNCDFAPYPIANRIVAACMKHDAFARAHPLKQQGAPANPGH